MLRPSFANSSRLSSTAIPTANEQSGRYLGLSIEAPGRSEMTAMGTGLSGAAAASADLIANKKSHFFILYFLCMYLSSYEKTERKASRGKYRCEGNAPDCAGSLRPPRSSTARPTSAERG